MRGMKVLCIYGEEEKDSICKGLKNNLTRVILLKDGHHFGGDYSAIAEGILKEME